MADELQDFVQHMLDSGAPQETIDEGIKLFQAQHAVHPVAANEPDTYWGGFAKGMGEGMDGGARGFIKGVVPGVVRGAAETLKMPYTLTRALVDTAVGGYNLYQDPSKVLAESGRNIGAIPGKVSDALSAELTKAGVDPEGYGNDVGNVTGNTMGALATGRAAAAAVPLVPSAVARGAGEWAETVGKHSQFGAGVVGLHQLAAGNPMGIITMGLPAVLRRSGRGLQRLGGGGLTEAEERAVENGGRNIDVKGPIKSIPFNPPASDAPPAGIRVPYSAPEPAPYRASAKAAVMAEQNADRLANIDGAKDGLTASEPTIHESTSATRGDGSHASMSTTFKKAAAETVDEFPGISREEVAALRKNNYSDKDIARLAANLKPEVAAPRPSVRIMGKPAADLAGPGIVPVEGVRAAPPVIDPAAQAVRDQTAPFHPTGKAATDLANGTVPTASHAPMPTDTRMDEMRAKFAEGPKPARVDTSQTPVSQSKKPKAATPAFTRDEITAAGGNPDVLYKNMPAEVEARILSNRASAAQTHYTNARTDKSLRSILEDSLLMRNMDRLR